MQRGHFSIMVLYYRVIGGFEKGIGGMIGDKGIKHSGAALRAAMS